MEIIYKNGDLLSSGLPLIAHGCNSRGVMGSGIAKQIRDRYPQAYNDYIKEYKKNNSLIMGSVIYSHCGDIIIANCITQKDYGRGDILYVSYTAIEQSIKDINNFALSMNIKLVGLPLIGCGLANGDWEIVSNIIEKYSINFQPIVYKL